MSNTFGDAVVKAYGQTYTLDLRAINDIQLFCLISIGVALVALLAVARHFSTRTFWSALGGSALLVFWAGAYTYLSRLHIAAHTREGHIYNLYWSELRNEPLYPCQLAVLPRHVGCLCNSSAIDTRRPLLGLGRCVEEGINSHTGENLLAFGLGVMTLGLTAIGHNPLRMRNSEVWYTGLLLEDSGKLSKSAESPR